MNLSLPYFDLLLQDRPRRTPPGGSAPLGPQVPGALRAAQAFEQFVHWGYWEHPSTAAGTAEDFIQATARLNDVVVGAADIQDGQTILDAGCGFGGTLASINERRRGMRLMGVNLDGRQIPIARAHVPSKGNNRALFIHADACRLPLGDEVCDRVLAVECIFHFPSRRRFLQEAARVLKPGGCLSLSDFVPARPGGAPLLGPWLERTIAKGYGTSGPGFDQEGSYSEMAREAGFKIEKDEDITRHTLPTYQTLLTLCCQNEIWQRTLLWPTRLMFWISYARILQYRLLAFRKI